MSRTFNLHAARAAAFWAGQAYGPAWDEVVVLEDFKTETRAILHFEPDHTVLAFRGTVNVANWVEDLDIALAPLAYGVKVHDGFLRVVEALLPQILGELLPGLTDKSTVKPLFIVGHSLGGAMATLAALFLQREGLPVHTVWTFGSPRVGNRAWRAHYQRRLGDRTWRIAARGDLVPVVPGLLAGYRHVGTEVLLDGDDEGRQARALVRPPRFYEIAVDSFCALRAVLSFHYADIVRFHSIDGDYLPLLNTATT